MEYTSANRVSFANQISLKTILIVLFVIDFSYQLGVRHLSPAQGILITFIDTLLYTALLWVAIRIDLAKVTIVFLALPYLFFIPGWLNNGTVAIIFPIFLYFLWQTIRSTNTSTTKNITVDDLITFIIILVWVNIAGAGGYGAQMQDYRMHNARLNDLINYSWPVSYGEDKNLVYYIGYFIPSAILGKLTSFTIAEKSMYIWTALGVTLAIRWLNHLVNWKYTFPAALLFIFFGPIDLLNIIYNTCQAGISLTGDFKRIIPDLDHVDFNTSLHINFFIGNFLSNTFQLYWSPQQVIAGWLYAGLATTLFLKKDTKNIIFIYALLCIWAPLVMLAMTPFIVLTIIMWFTNKKYLEIITPGNIIGSASLLIPLVIFYLSGSTSANLSVWITNAFSWREHWDSYIIFNLSGWAIFAAVVFYKTNQESQQHRLWFYFLLAAFVAIQIRTFGEYSDLLCRGSAPLMFILLVYILRAVKNYWVYRAKFAAIAILLIVSTGFFSAIVENIVAITFYGTKQPIRSLTDYKNAYPNFGPDNTLFEQLLIELTSNIFKIRTYERRL